MYTEEPRRIDWGNVIKKGLIILLISAVIFLIIWLIARNNSNAINVDYGNDNSSEITNTDSYSEIFIDNYRYFHDTAKEYFLISELPENGETLKYTLQELIDKGLILPFSYGDSTCDTEASYVYVTNNNGKYTMTTTLICDKEVAKTTEELGCNKLCEDNSCEPNKDVTEIAYQYKKPYQVTETVYSCPSGYTKTGSGSNTKCIKDNSSTIKATKNITYTCPDGYKKTGIASNAKCTKEGKTTIDATKLTSYECADGYTKIGTGENTKCYKNIKDSIEADYKLTYDCPEGYDKSGEGKDTKCTKEVKSTVDAKATTTYSCSEGTLSGSNCIVPYTYTTSANSYYYCPSGSRINSKCRIYYTNSYYQTYQTYKGKTYNGCSYSGSYTASCSSYTGCTMTYYKYYCSKQAYYEKAAELRYSCSSGTRSGSKCIHNGTKTVAATATTTYKCTEGIQDSNDKAKCIVTKIENGKVIEKKEYYCKDGYELSGNRCYKTTDKYEEAIKKTSYSCPDGYIKDGTKCTSDGTVTKKAVKNVNYVCPEGYTKTGLGSASKCTKGNTESVNPTKSTKTVTKYKYQCSKETSLDGWERTGKTCKLDETSSK